jgi:hypothetical protein
MSKVISKDCMLCGCEFASRDNIFEFKCPDCQIAEIERRNYLIELDYFNVLVEDLIYEKELTDACSYCGKEVIIEHFKCKAGKFFCNYNCATGCKFECGVEVCVYRSMKNNSAKFKLIETYLSNLSSAYQDLKYAFKHGGSRWVSDTNSVICIDDIDYKTNEYTQKDVLAFMESVANNADPAFSKTSNISDVNKVPVPDRDKHAFEFSGRYYDEKYVMNILKMHDSKIFNWDLEYGTKHYALRIFINNKLAGIVLPIDM